MEFFDFEEAEFVLLSKEVGDPITSSAVHGVFKTFDAAKAHENNYSSHYPDDVFQILDIKTAAKKMKFEKAPLNAYKEQFAIHAAVHYIKEELDKVLPPQFTQVNSEILDKAFVELHAVIERVEKELEKFAFYGNIDLLPFVCVVAPILTVKIVLSGEENFVDAVFDPLLELNWVWENGEKGLDIPNEECYNKGTEGENGTLH